VKADLDMRTTVDPGDWYQKRSIEFMGVRSNRVNLTTGVAAFEKSFRVPPVRVAADNDDISVQDCGLALNPKKPRA